MAGPPPYPDSNGDTGLGSGRRLTTSTPRWVFVFWCIVIVIVLLFVLLHLTGHQPTHG